jgi:hypothetical protein
MSEYVTVKIKDLEVILSRFGKYVTYDAIRAADSIKKQLGYDINQTDEMNYIERKTRKMQINYR